ncbi:MAG TPA: globin-coupled sensor protein [Gaiellaceae bacterium]
MSKQADLHLLYRINERNVAARRSFVGLDDRDRRTLTRLRRWAHKAAAPIATELTDHHFEFPATRAFFEAYVADKPISVADLQQGAQAAHFAQIFDHAGEPHAFGVPYFEQLLAVGKLHNKIDLPLKWYLGIYPTYLGIVRKHLRRRFLHRPLLRLRAIQAIERVQGETAKAVAVVEDGTRRSEQGVEVVEQTREAFIRIGSSVEDVTGRITGIAEAMAEVAAVAEQSSASTEQVSASTEETSASTQEIAASAQELARTAEELEQLFGRFQLS